MEDKDLQRIGLMEWDCEKWMVDNGWGFGKFVEDKHWNTP